ncbi:hypothetical protein OS493_003440 [Desmophyllum pertusum]|uniref:Roc domain-containing protein n=1 Tax=Desmophyllum pertusum TaxID=174260 RepID=A0A9X0A5H0_9CNID|nr:hypothetical protein OS493_003440 [Desmophyllum pertusum]
MALDVQGIRLTDDHTLESASEVMSQLQFERRLPNGRDAYLQTLLRNLGFRSEQDPGQDGTEYKQFVFQGQCLILGDARVGKTSLKKSLMGNPFDADEPGTKGVEMSLVDRKWRNQHSDAGLMFGSFARFRESVLYQGVLFGPAGVEVVLDEEKVVLNFQKLRKALHTKFSSLKLKILDFSGDKEYYAYHHIFQRDQAIYIVVFNMANFADDNFRNVAAKIQRLCFWLESICSKAASKTPIFLVGTHRGHMVKTCLKGIDINLRKHLLDSFSDELVKNEADKLLYFPIENSHGKNDREIQNLQRKIMSIAEEHKATMGGEIPFSWIKIQDAIINLRKNKNAKFCVTLDQFPTSFGKYFICSNWSGETLKYFNEKGLVMYVDAGQHSELSKWVLLKPEILIDIIIQLVTSLTDDEELEQHGFTRDWKLLHHTGMLTESLMRNILVRVKENEEAMKGFLEEYDIICPLFYNVNHEREEAKVAYFVPSLLPLSENGKHTSVVQ